MQLMIVLLVAFPALVFLGLDSVAVFLVCVAYGTKLYTSTSLIGMNRKVDDFQVLCVGILLFAALASNVAYGNAPRFFKYATYYVGFYAVYVAGTRAASEKGLRTAGFVFLASNIVFGFVQFLIGHPVLYNPLIDVKFLNETSARYFGQFIWSDTGRSIRPNGFYLYPTSYGFGLVLTSSILFLRSRAAAGVSGIVFGFMSLTRNSVIGSLAGLAFDFTSRRLGRPNQRIALFAATIIAIFLTYFVIFATGDTGSVGDFVGKVFRRGLSASESTLLRAKLYADSLHDFSSNNAVFPWFGFSDVKGRVLLGQRVLPLGSHSTFLAVLYRFGAVGFAGFVALLFSMGGKVIRIGRGGLVVALLTMMITEDILIDPINLLIAGAVLGLLSRQQAISVDPQNH